MYGYDNIPEALPDDMGFSPKINKLFYYIGAIRNTLIDAGFSEVETYTFTDNGEMEVENPLAVDIFQEFNNFRKAMFSDNPPKCCQECTLVVDDVSKVESHMSPPMVVLYKEKYEKKENK